MAYFTKGKLQISVVILLIFESINSFSSELESVRVKADALKAYTAIHQSARSQNDGASNIYIYIGSSAESLVLQAAKIQIDDNSPVRYVYSEMESGVLLDGGLHAINSLNLTSGNHRIRAELVALKNDAGPNTDRIFARIDQQVNVGKEAHIELELISDGMKKMLGEAELALRNRRLTL